MDLVKELFEGSRLALARSITAVENEYDNAIEIMQSIYPKTGRARILGITGAPGAGKSTLTDKVVKHYLDQGKTVGIVAIDPTSPFSGGAILGDRIRMNDLTLNENVFIRSMGTRGSLGGLSKKTADVVKLMDAYGMDIVIVETVGVGQSEVDIVKNAFLRVRFGGLVEHSSLEQYFFTVPFLYSFCTMMLPQVSQNSLIGLSQAVKSHFG